MTDSRRSYWKTVALFAVAAAAGVALLAGAALAPGRSPGAWGALPWLGWAAAVLLLAAGTVAASLVVGGGLISLRRDALEARGVPYAPRRPREGRPGLVGSAVRRMVRAARERLTGRTLPLALRAGEEVEVRSLAEICATLDERATLDGLPFMPEMAAFCGRRFRVFRRVDKINDWVGHTGLRRPRDTVMLEQLCCDGAGHGGCQARCQLRWKEAWLKRAGSAAEPPGDGRAASGAAPAGEGTRGRAPTLADLERLTRREDGSGEIRYVCQVTELAAGSTPLRRNDPLHFLRDFVRGNLRLGPLMAGVCLAMFNGFQRRRGGVGFPSYALTPQAKSPHETLDLRPGDAVRVKTKRQIEPTLNAQSRNRGLWFDGEMLRFCGGTYRVGVRVERLIEERTGKMLQLGSPCIILDGVAASGEYQGFCAQNESIFWREIWLERA